MMGLQQPQPELFSYSVNLEKRIHADHPLRRVLAMVDFTFARQEVAHTYGGNGQVSVDPAVLLKLMFLLFSENIRSERELMRRLPERLDYLWFLGYGLDDDIPNHSVLSKARKRWGPELFEQLFIRTVRHCVEAGLVDGEKVHLDGSLIDAHASRDSVIKADPETIARIKTAYAVQERKLDENTPPSARTGTNQHLVSTTDPDAPCVTQSPTSGPARPRYKHHRMIDDRQGVITAVATTPADHPEADQTLSLAQQHQQNTTTELTTLTADRGYGTAKNYCDLVEHGIRPHISPFHRPKETGLYPKEAFRYDVTKDHYTCPAGQILARRRPDPYRQTTEYKAGKKACARCPLREHCTTSKQGRSLSRHWRETSLQLAQELSKSPEAYQDRARRRHLMEGSFAQAANKHHFKKSRWRRLWRQQIQDWLIAAVQNIAILCGKTPAKIPARLKTPPKIGTAAAALAHFVRTPQGETYLNRWYTSILGLSAPTTAA